MCLVESSPGSTGVDSSELTTIDAIDEIDLSYVISCGISFGVDKTKQKYCDVLVSTKIQAYEKSKITPDKIIPRGDRIPADHILLSATRAAKQLRPDLRVTEGLMLSGETIITNRLNHRLRRCDRKRFARYGVAKKREKGSIPRATGWYEKERGYARMEKTKPRHLVLPLPYRVHPQT